MTFTFFVYLTTLLSLVVTYQVRESIPVLPQDPLRPGDLLRSLDALTSDVQAIYSPLTKTSADRRAYDDEDDYDRAYEDFVSKYFSQGEEDLDSDDEEERASDDHSTAYESSTDQDEEAEAEESKVEKKVSKSKKCERVEIGDESCLVCEDPRSNERSKSCSYSSDSKPKNYKFSKERSSQQSNDDGDDEEGKNARNMANAQKREVPKKKGKYLPRKTSIKAILDPLSEKDVADSSRCLRKIEDGMVCFYCGTVTENTRECMADMSNPKKRRVNESSTRDSKTKKVYKRMVTYSFENDARPKVEGELYEASSGY